MTTVSDVLKTRDGKVVKGPGSWELEQLKKEGNKFDVPKPSSRRVNSQGRRKQTIEENPMLYITEPKVGGRFVVSTKHIGFASKTFIFENYGGRDKAFEEAVKFRNELVKQRDAL